MFDWWQTNLSTSILAYKDVLTCLSYAGAQWVVGNHDNALTGFLDTPGISRYLPTYMPIPRKAFEATINDRRFAFCHGHEADPTCRDLNPGVGNITAVISALLEDRNKGPNRGGVAVEDAFIGHLEIVLNIWRKLSLQHNRRDELLDGVEAYRNAVTAEVIVYGHTHEAGNIGDYHYNTGCWCRNTDTFVRIDEGIRLLEWDGTQPKPFAHLLRG